MTNSVKAPIKYIADFVGEHTALYPQSIFDMLWEELDWIKFIGAPRREYWSNDFNAPYTYGRGLGERTYEAQPFHEDVLAVRDALLRETGVYYEACFINGYEDAQQALGWHSDDSPNIDHTKPIAVVSVGEEREIEYRSNEDPSDKTRISLANGSLFEMGAGMQSTHQHRIPKAGFVAEPRISLTFRSLLDPNA